jgi:hypothetical protein
VGRDCPVMLSYNTVDGDLIITLPTYFCCLTDHVDNSAARLPDCLRCLHAISLSIIDHVLWLVPIWFGRQREENEGASYAAGSQRSLRERGPSTIPPLRGNAESPQDSKLARSILVRVSSSLSCLCCIDLQKDRPFCINRATWETKLHSNVASASLNFFSP